MSFEFCDYRYVFTCANALAVADCRSALASVLLMMLVMQELRMTSLKTSSSS